ncbi:MAG: HlyD family secretion protein [Rhizobiales bacterium]|nr:HlyD family secretion protein [Hyphomicrobiales bacterium]
MIELLLCSLVTILPDYLFRRFVQGKRLGREITLYSIWFELRYGITACVFLTIALFTMILYFHPSATNAISFYRTVPILPEGSGRVEKVLVSVQDTVKAGEPIFLLDSTKQTAALETAQRRLAEVDAAITLAKSQLVVQDAQIQEAQSAYQQALDELETKTTLLSRGSPSVAPREVERLQNIANGRQAAVAAAVASKQTTETQIASVLPAQQESARAQAAEAQVDLDKTTVRAGVDGRLEQFTLRKGDIVNPLMRPAGVLIPSEAGQWGLIAGFNQLEAQVIRRGMLAEASCVTNPLKIIPMVVSNVQGLIASGQIRASDQLIDVQQVAQPGTITDYLEPLYESGFEGIPPGSTCLVNAYTDNHDRLAEKDVGTFESIALHVVDTVGVVHAIVLRIQALVLPFKTLVFSGGH